MTLTKTTNQSMTSFYPKLFLHAAIFSGLCLLGSCTSLDTLVVNVEKPAQITLPSNIDHIVIVDNTIPQPEDIGHAEYIKGRRTNSQISVNMDSANYILASNLFDKLANKEYFADVIFYEEPIREYGDFRDIVPLDSTVAKEICMDNKADAIISLDRFLVSTISNEDDLEFGTIAKYLDAKMDVRFQVYSNKGTAISPPFYLNDSIYWATAYNDDIPLSDTLPSREQAVKEAAQYMGEKVANALAPYWNNELRWYFGDVKAANKMMNNSDWAGAQSLWKSAYEKESKNIKRKARLANNIALSYELSDQIKEAVKWITISCDLFEKTEETSIDSENLIRATQYKEDLLTRYNDFRLLNMKDIDSN